MKINVAYTRRARKDLQKLEKQVARRITKKIQYFSLQDSPLVSAKKLKPSFEDLYRFRIGKYRAIFKLDKKNTLTLLLILNIGHRKDLYS